MNTKTVTKIFVLAIQLNIQISKQTFHTGSDLKLYKRQKRMKIYRDCLKYKFWTQGR